MAEIAQSLNGTAVTREVPSEQMALVSARDLAEPAVRLLDAADDLRQHTGAAPSSHERQRLEDCLELPEEG
jgi:hypothetical protein